MSTLYAASFQPPDVPASTSGPPAWVLLNRLGYVADRGNATTAEALTSTGQPIAFSFFPAEPPGVSHFCVHCPGLDVSGYSTHPLVVHCAGNLVLLTISLKHHREDFLYRASRRGRPQSLELVQGLTAQLCKIKPPAYVAVVPCGEHFALAALGYPREGGRYDFHVFRSKLRTWTAKVVTLRGVETVIYPDKVIVLGGGEIGWVDLGRGILVCNPLEENPVFRVIPPPTLLPANRVGTGFRFADQFRDMVCVDGMIKLVELEHTKLYDQDLTSSDTVETEPKGDYTGWRLVTWNRTVSSNCWRRGSFVHVDDFVAMDDMRHSALLPGRGLVEKETGKNLRPSYPVLSMDGTDVVYLKCKVDRKDNKVWVVALDMTKKTIQDVAPFQEERPSSGNNITCAYLNAE
ncbi:unnamed protein product [Alopecurus aequalis]